MAPVITSPVPGEEVSGTVNLIGTYGGVTGQVMNGTTVLDSVVLVPPVPFNVPVDTTPLANGAQPLSFSDGVDVATVNVIVNNVVAPPVTALSVSSPAANAAEGATFNVVGIAGADWVNVAVYDDATGAKVSTDVTPDAGGAFTIPVSMGTLSGTRQLDVTGFSVPAGQSGGTQATVSVSVTITPAPALAVSAPANGFSQASPVTVSGTTNQSSVVISNAAGAVLATATPVNGAFSTSLTLAAGSYALTATAGTATPVAVSGTVTAVVNPPSVDLYWGADIHPVQGGIYASRSVAQQKADCQQIGLTTVCADAYTLGDCSTLAGLIPQWAPITLVPELIPVSGTLSGSTTTMYNNMKSFGAAAASILAGSPLVVFGNEDDIVAFLGGNVDGTLPSQFNATQTGLYLAAYSGFADGWHSVDTGRTTKLAINGTYIHTGWLEMLVNGTLPNGSAAPHGAPDVDAYTWHDYETGGNPASTSGYSGVVDLFTAIAAITSKPIYLSETGKGDPSVSSSTVSSYINSIFPEVLAQTQWKGNWYYELYDFSDGAYGLRDASGNIKPEGTALKNLIAANPR